MQTRASENKQPYRSPKLPKAARYSDKNKKKHLFLKKNRERFGGFKIKLYFCTRKQAPKGAEMQT